MVSINDWSVLPFIGSYWLLFININNNYNNYLFIFFYITDIVKRILQVVLKIRYDVESLAQRLQQMENKIEESSLTKTAGNDPTYIETLNQEDDYESILPLMNEDDLDMFGNKLSNRSFRLNVVSYLEWFIICMFLSV